MITLISVCIFFGFYLWYATTKRIKVEPWLGIEPWAKQRHKESKLVGSFFLLIAAAITLYVYGIGAGTFVFLGAFMTIGCLVILLVPMKLMNRLVLALIFMLLFFAEFFL